MCYIGECDKRKEKLLQLQRSRLERHVQEMDTLKKVCVCVCVMSVCVCVCVCVCDECVCVCVCALFFLH